MTTPQTHIDEGHKLSAVAMVDLYEIQLVGTAVVLRFKNENTATWQGYEWEGIAIKMSGDNRSADEEESRPVLQMMNPAGVFNAYVRAGYFDLARVIRKRVLRTHLEADTNLYDQRMWFVSRPREMITNQSLTLELRSLSEGVNFQIPVRMFMPPDFKAVTL